jgi:formylglycine-generating enzyme required for sulfatase activity
MLGNVWQWTADWYAASYTAATQTDPHGPDAGTQRALRGGSWQNLAWNERASYRGRDVPGFRTPYIGVRCAID